MQAAALEDNEWPADAQLAILRLATTEPEFSADDLAKVLRKPPVANWTGLAFTHAQRAGVIEWVRYVRSNNKTRRGGSVSVWRRKQRRSQSSMSKVAMPVDRRVRGMSGDARLYRLNEPLNGYDYVVVSAVDERPAYRVHETYIFGADHTGHVLNWGELEGSYKGGTDHEAALRGAGYEVAQ